MDDSIYAAADAPFCVFWKELHKVFPDAKVVFLTLPGGQQAQVRSTYALYHAFKAIQLAIRLPPFRTLAEVIYVCGVWESVKNIKPWEGFLAWVNCFSNAELSNGLYLTNSNILRKSLALKDDDIDKVLEDVRRTIPKDQLLEYSVSEGWGPICSFFGVPVPDVNFPREDYNDTVHLNRLRYLMWFSGVIGSIVVLGGIYALVEVLSNNISWKFPALINSILLLLALWMKNRFTV